jgi:hypothetical protein
MIGLVNSDFTSPEKTVTADQASLAVLLERAAVAYAVIGGHAVNAWLEPRATMDVDVTVYADAAGQQRLRSVLIEAGCTMTHEHGAALPSGPDFVRFASADRRLVVEIQAAKTDFQRELVDRAIKGEDGLRVATPEDLIVLKLLAYRPKDRIDLEGLLRLPNLDWTYVEKWTDEWKVRERLDKLRRDGTN